MIKNIVIVLVFVVCSCNGQTFSLISKGKSPYEILVAKNADKDEIDAAKILQNYINQVSKVNLPLVFSDRVLKNNLKNKIIIAKQKNIKFLSKYSQLQEQGVGILIRNGNIYLYGGANKGILYAIYSFVEKYLGCRFFSPYKKYIPYQKNINLPVDLNYSYNSPFIHRQYFYMGSFRPSQEYLDWNKLHSYGDEKQSKWGEYIRHNIEDYFPVETYFKKKPLYFAFINGKRVQDQLDFSNPELTKELMEKIGEKIRENPKISSIAINPSDNENYCECSVCKKNQEKYQAKSASLFLLLNQISQKFPQINFSTLAYKTNRKPPVGLEFNKNVNIVLSDIETNKIEPIEFSNNVQNKSFCNDLQEWKKSTDDILIWHYIGWFPNSLAPLPIFDKIQSDIQFFAKNKEVKGIFLEGDGGLYAHFGDLKAYLSAQLLWDPTLDRDILILEYLSYDYGYAKDDIYKYYQSLQNNFNRYHTLLNTGDESIENVSKGYLSPSLILEYRKKLNAAKLKVNRYSQYYINIDCLELGLDYVELETMKLHENSYSKKDFNEKAQAFKAKLDLYKIDKINVYLLQTEEYIQSLK